MKTFRGTVIKTRTKTATVAVDRVVSHPVYKKRMTKTKKYHVHDEKGHAVGDVVEFVATRPMSKFKKWTVVEAKKKTTKK